MGRYANDAYYGGNPNEGYTFYDRVHGPYWLTWYVMMFCNCVVPQALWSPAVRRYRPALLAIGVALKKTQRKV